MTGVLPDVLQPGLKVIFCGTASGTVSARAGAYYAGPGNRFWDTLYKLGLTPHRLQPGEFRTLPDYGIGLTDLAKHTAGADSSLRVQDFDTAALRLKVKRFAPRAFAFNGKRAAQEFYGRESISYGRQPKPIGDTVVFVLPSTSGLSIRYWDESYWQELAAFLQG